MKAGWTREPLANFILEIKDGGTPSRANPAFFGNDIPWCVVKDIKPKINETREKLTNLGLANCSAKLWPAGSVIISLGATIGEIGLAMMPVATKQGLAGIIPDPKRITASYLIYALQSCIPEIKGMARGTTIKEVRPNRLAEELLINVPTLGEQQRIVAVLDKAFAGIATVAVNAQKNLTNARALFKSYLKANLHGDDGDWLEKPFGECLRLKSGDGLTSSAMINGPFPVFGGNGIAGYHNESNLTGDNVIIGRVGALCGNARHIKEPIWLTDNAFKVTDNSYSIDNAYLKYLLNFVDLRSFARQAAQPVISNSSLKDIMIRFPLSAERQREIVSNLDALSAKCEEFAAGLKQKTAALTELKQSLFQKAFAGELT